MNDENFFLKPSHPYQKRYEALRASFVENMPAKEVAEKFDYSVNTVYVLRRDFKAGKLNDFFMPIQKGRPPDTSQNTSSLDENIIALRKMNLSIPEIKETLEQIGYSATIDYIRDVLSDAGFVKLFRRTRAERIQYLSTAKSTPESTDVADFPSQGTFSTAYSGLFFMIPFIMNLNIHSLFQDSGMHGTSKIPTLNSLLSFLSLKLIGNERLRHATELSFDSGSGLFAGLNTLPKATTMTRYAYGCSHDDIRNMLRKWTRILHDKGLISGQVINLDFHSIPYWGDEANHLENHWVPVRGKAMKSILSFFAQDMETTYLCYSNGDIRKTDQNDEVMNFVTWYQESSQGNLPGLLVFDSKLTTLDNLAKLAHQGIPFLTLRRRGKNILREIDKISNWKIYHLDELKRIHKCPKVHSRKYHLKGYGHIRELVIRGNGRDNPTLMISNAEDYTDKELLKFYARRWRIENNIQENVDFFNLNSLSSPVVVKVDFDIAITLIANSVFKYFARNLKYYERAKPKALYRNFVEGTAQIQIDSDKIVVVSSRKNTTPMMKKLLEPYQGIKVPWLHSKSIFYKFK